MNRNRRNIYFLIAIPVVFMFAFFVIPLLMATINSLQTSNGSYGIEWYWKILTESYYLATLKSTLLVSLLVTAVTVIPGFLVAYYIAIVTEKRLVRRIIYIIVILPLFTSNVVRAFGFMVLLGRNGVVNQFLIWSGIVSEPIKFMYTDLAVVIGLSYIFVPFMILAIASAMQNIDKSLLSASSDLGANTLSTFRHVVLPLSLPGILAGSVIVFTLSVSAYVTPSIMLGGRGAMMSSLIYDQYVSFLNFPFGAALAVTLMLATLLVIIFYNYVFERKTAWSRI